MNVKLDPTERLNLMLSAGAIGASFALATPHFASSLALGAALEVVNFRALHRTAQALFSGEVNGGGAWVGVLGLRFGLVAIGIVLGLHAGADPIALVVGLSLAMPATVIAAIWNRPPVIEQPLAPPLPPDDPSWETYSIWRGREVEREEDEDR